MSKPFSLRVAAGVLLVACWPLACGDSLVPPPSSTDTDASADADADADPTAPDPGPTDIDNPNNPFLDTDCDGLSDAEEFSIRYAGGASTNPRLADSDGDGIPDGVEVGRTSSVDPNCTFVGDRDPNTRTSPVLADTDGDALPDGIEDRDRDGRRDPGETDPNAVDTDGDGLADGAEDQNHDGVRDPSETDPLARDTDGDRIPDGVEAGSCTNALLVDSDGDGIADGVEDANLNGKVDEGELDPCNPTDGAAGSIGALCHPANARSVSFTEEPNADLRLALPSGFQAGPRVPIEAGGNAVGLLAADEAAKVAAIVFKRAVPDGSTGVADDEIAIRRAAFNSATREIGRSYTSWDGYPALFARYRSADLAELNAFSNTLTRSLVPGSTGSLQGSMNVQGPFVIEARYVRRSNASLLVTFAVTPANLYSAESALSLVDTAAGSTLAQAGDADAARCASFVARPAAVDFLFVVDDSGSMASAQQALANSATSMATRLNNAAIDWRFAMVTTSYTHGNKTNTGVRRGFTRNVHRFRAWLTTNSTCSGGQCNNLVVPPGQEVTCSDNKGCWVGITGDGSERPLSAARVAINDLSVAPGDEDSRLRPDAKLVVVLLTDTRDQSTETVASLQQYFLNTGNIAGDTLNPTGRPVTVHGILCPHENATANSSTWCQQDEDPRNPRHLDVVLATGGVYGSIQNSPTISTTANAIVDVVIDSSGYHAQEPAIGSSVKVALDAVTDPLLCPNASDLPRSRVHGFDVDRVSGAISFFGACRPAEPSATRAVVSYRAWDDRTPDPNGGVATCNACDTCSAFETCNTTSCACECVQTASCGPGLRFDPNACDCVCDTTALACGPGRTADPNLCGCACQADCGGCPAGTSCNASKCACEVPR